MADQKTTREAMPWENDPIVEPAGGNAPWENDPILEQNAPQARMLSSADIDPKLEAPAIVRAQVGALDKPEDRLAAVRKTYPDAQPYDGDNFIMTDPQTGKTMIYNQPGWMPSGGDIASILPEIGEGVGAVGGAIGGGIAGGTSGSVVPVAGTAAGAVAGGMLGAGAGATVGREATQRGLNYLFGNEDTRTGGEQAWDAAKTFGLNAAGEGLGVAAAPLVKKAARGIGDAFSAGPKGFVAGRADDAALAGQRAADMRAIGAEPTAGMVNGSAETAVKEQALAAQRAGKPIQDRIEQAFSAMDGEAGRIVGDITPQTMSRQELGQALKDQAAAAKRGIKENHDALWDRVGTLTGDAPAQGNATRQFAEGLAAERAGLSNSNALNKGAEYDALLRQAGAVSDDIGSGVNFMTLKEARTNIGRIANSPELDATMKARAQGLYDAISKDMEATAKAANPDAFQAWRKANNATRRANETGSVFNSKSAIDPILKAQTPEQAADWVLAQANKGGTRLNAVRRQIERSEGGADLWNTLTGSTVERMGIDASGNFSPTTMLRGWAKISDEAKNAMFEGTARRQYREDLDRLARIADNMKGYRRLDNHSNTNKAAGALAALNPFDKSTIIGSVLAGPQGFAVAQGAKAAGYGYKKWQVKMLTDPRTVNWLAQVPAAQMQKGGLQKHVERLAAMAGSVGDNATAVAINEYLREIGYSK
ncbi:hypothetical protein [Rhizobium sp. 2MFCol3.1]|uniref:hypothetical protein n=1 Tax=Rhizobium sp. 2MFCol3.1 TaxID=1246459 RepID=UPI00036359F9|nr:hypothetical protein [Rhizobium sp. 2MFCol3.1]